VLADGSIVNANNTANTDLFRALKGGGNNFGKALKYPFISRRTLLTADWASRYSNRSYTVNLPDRPSMGGDQNIYCRAIS
jgi:hypothetical protein